MGVERAKSQEREPMGLDQERGKFLDQLVKGFDSRVKYLKVRNFNMANQLEDILPLLQAELEECAMSGTECELDDLVIKKDEWKSIYNKPVVKDACRKIGVVDFGEFLDLLFRTDLEREVTNGYYVEIDQHYYNINRLSVGGHAIDFKNLPLGISSEERAGIEKAVGLLAERSEIVDLIDMDLECKYLGYGRFEFVVMDGRKKVKYVASQLNVLRVVDDRPEGIDDEIEDLYHNLHYKVFSFSEKLRKLDMDVDNRSSILYNIWPYEYLSEKVDLSWIPEELGAEYFVLAGLSRSMLDKSSIGRTLYDYKQDLYVYEKNSFGGASPCLYYGETKKELDNYGVGSMRSEEYANSTISVIDRRPKEGYDVVTTYVRIDGRVKAETFGRDDGSKDYKRVYYENDGQIKKISFKNGSTAFDINYNDGQKMSKIYYEVDQYGGVDESKAKDKVMFAKNGVEVGTYKFYIEKYGYIDPDEYIDFLAKVLDTPEKLNMFLEYFMEYVGDGIVARESTHKDFLQVSDMQDTKEIREREEFWKPPKMCEDTDYWQFAHETVTRIKDNMMLGDCDDYAFLAKEILKRQGQHALVFYVPDPNPHDSIHEAHATCVWVDIRPDGKYDAYSVGTFGLDKNGGSDGADGYDDLEKAINSLMVKFDSGGLGLRGGGHYRVDATVQILEIPKRGERKWRSYPVEVFLDRFLYDQFSIIEAGFDDVEGTLSTSDYAVDAGVKILRKYSGNSEMITAVVENIENAYAEAIFRRAFLETPTPQIFAAYMKFYLDSADLESFSIVYLDYVESVRLPKKARRMLLAKFADLCYRIGSDSLAFEFVHKVKKTENDPVALGTVLVMEALLCEGDYVTDLSHLKDVAREFKRRVPLNRATKKSYDELCGLLEAAGLAKDGKMNLD